MGREINSIDALRCCAHHYVLRRGAFALSDWLFPLIRCLAFRTSVSALLTMHTRMHVKVGRERERKRERKRECVCGGGGGERYSCGAR